MTKPAPDLTRNFANPRGIRPAPQPVPPGARPEIFVQDVFTKLQRAREHYEEFRLPQAELDRLVR